MEVILKEDVAKLGSRGDVVKVAEGFDETICCRRSWPSWPTRATRPSSNR